jgi:hypothetical protein
MPYVIDGRTYKVLFSNIASVGAVPASRIIAAGTGLTGGGSLAADRVIAIANGGVGFDQLAASGATAGTYGSGTTVPVLTVDVKGRVTAATTTPVVISGYVPEGRSVIAGTGLTGGGTLTSNVTLAVNFASSDPQALGTATAGVSTAAARGDHVHPAVNLSDTSQTQGALPLGRGGTGDALSPVAGAVVYSTGTRFALSALGLPGQVLVSNGTSAPSWLTVSGVGTVTSVNVSGGTTGLTFTGGPITSAGTITAGGTLGVANGGTGTGTAFTSGSLVFAGSGGVYSQNNANLFWDNINSRLGIGTGSPLARLHLFDTLAPEARLQIGTNTSQGAYTFYTGGVNEGGIGFTPVSSILNVYAGRSAAWGGKITFTTDTAERMRILNTGEVCVGRTNSLNTGVLSVLGTGTQAITAQVTVDGNSLIQGYNSSTGLAFQILGTGQGYYAGNLGIGTTSPAARIHTNGGAGGINAVLESNTSADTRVEFRNNATRAGYLYWDANEVRLLADPTRAVTLFTNGVERMRVDNAGNVGVGTTPSAWNSSYRAIEIGNTVGLTRGGAAEMDLLWNAFVNSSAQYVYRVTAAATRYQQTTGEHIWSTAVSGTAGATISFSERMRINNAGAVVLPKMNLSTDTPFLTGANINSGANPLAIGTTSTGVVALFTNTTERLRVKANGQVRFVPLAAAPGSPEAGDVYYDSTTNKLRCYNGTIWNDLF